MARCHHIPRVKLRPWLSLVALQEVEEGGWECLHRFSLNLFEPFRKVGEIVESCQQQEALAYFLEKKPRLKKDITSLKSLSKLRKESKGSTVVACQLMMGPFLGHFRERLWTTTPLGLPQIRRWRIPCCLLSANTWPLCVSPETSGIRGNTQPQ